MKNRRLGGLGLYLIFIIIVVIAWYLMTSQKTIDASYTYSDFVNDIAENKIVSVTIEQNNEVPTGAVSIILKNSITKVIAVSDVNDSVPYLIKDVPGESMFLKILPILIIVAAVFLMFITMNNQQAPTGGNSKMMNFGKSRARMTTSDQQTVTFKEVAGLKEEKEELEELVDFLRDPKKIFP